MRSSDFASFVKVRGLREFESCEIVWDQER